MGELLDESDADLFGSHTQNQDLLDDEQLFASLCETSVSDGGALVHDCSQAFDALANLDYYHADEIGNSEKSYLESIQKDLFVA